MFCKKPPGYAYTGGFLTCTQDSEDILNVDFCCSLPADIFGCAYGDERDTTMTRGLDGRWYVDLWDYFAGQHVIFRTTAINLDCPPSGTDADWEFYSSDDSTEYMFIQTQCRDGSLDTVGTDPVLISNVSLQIPSTYDWGSYVMPVPTYPIWDGKLYWDMAFGFWRNTSAVSIALVGGTTWLDCPIGSISLVRYAGGLQLDISVFSYIGKQTCEEHFYGPVGLYPNFPAGFGTWGSTMYPVIGAVPP
jgi:hypothetical protein